MDGSSEEEARDYPPRCYPEGESKLEPKTLCQSCRMKDYSLIKDAIGDDVWESMKEEPIGVIAKLVDSEFVWSAKTVHYLLCRQLRVNKNELWCIVGGQPIRFSLLEFGEITGLNTDPKPKDPLVPKIDYTTLWKELKVPDFQGPKYDELFPALAVCRTWPTDKRKRLGLLILLCVGIFGNHHNSRIPFECAKAVFDDDALKTYPWGRVAFKHLLKAITGLNPVGKSFTLVGMTPVLLVWAYESVTCFGERFGRLIDGQVLPLIRWAGRRTRASFETVIAEEIATYKEVRVRKFLVEKDGDEIFPQWEDEAADPQLDNLIRDIQQRRFVPGFWDGKRNQNSKKVKAIEAVEDEHPRKKRKTVKKLKKVTNNDDGSEEEEAEGTVKGSGGGKQLEDVVVQEDVVREAAYKGLLDLVSKLYGRFDIFDTKFETFETSFKAIVSNLEKAVGDRVEARMDAKYGPRFIGVDLRVDTIENELRQMKDRLRLMGIDGAINSGQNDEFSIQGLQKQIQNETVNSPPVYLSFLAELSLLYG